jgi:hypothetical protein
MIHNIIKDKGTRLFLILGGFFVANTLMAEVIGVKLFSLEKTLHLDPANMTLLGESGVRFLSILTSIIIIFAFLVFYGAIHLAPDNYWIGSQKENGVPDMQAAFAQVLGQGMNIIFASLTAFLVGQLADATVFKKIKQITGEKGIWMRATVSTLVSQLIDTICVSYIYLYFSLGFSFPRVTAIALTGYVYKFSVAILCTPIIYLVHHLIEEYLGKSKAAEMKKAALQH